MGWLITLGILILLAILPLGVSLKYNGEGPLVRLILGPVRLTVYPAKKKQKKDKPKKEKSPRVSKEKQEAMPEKPPIPPKKEDKETGGSWKDFLPLVRTALDLLGDFRRKLRVDRLELKLTLAGDDPCDLATNYGKTWTAVGALMPQLEKIFVIRKKDVTVECDFIAAETLVIARLDLTVTLGRLLALVIRYAIRGIREFIQIKNKRKGGAKQ